jgi:hypothetical protein
MQKIGDCVIWNGKADISWYEKNPAADIFTICTAEELAGLSELVSRGENMLRISSFHRPTIIKACSDM